MADIEQELLAARGDQSAYATPPLLPRKPIPRIGLERTALRRELLGGIGLLQDDTYLPYRRERPRALLFRLPDHGQQSAGHAAPRLRAGVPTLQRGTASAGCRGMILGDQDVRLRHFHQTIDRYLAGEP